MRADHAPIMRAQRFFGPDRDDIGPLEGQEFGSRERRVTTSGDRHGEFSSEPESKTRPTREALEAIMEDLR